MGELCLKAQNVGDPELKNGEYAYEIFYRKLDDCIKCPKTELEVK